MEGGVCMHKWAQGVYAQKPGVQCAQRSSPSSPEAIDWTDWTEEIDGLDGLDEGD